VGGFKIINGLPKMGKGPMTSKEDQELNNEVSLPQPTQAGRIELCTESINKAMRCLGDGDKDCITRLIEELIKANCHNGNAVGREIADKVKDVVHEVWLVSDDECRCKLLMMFRSLDMSRWWVMIALRTFRERLDWWFAKCGIDWESRTTRNNIVKRIEDLLREKFG
jgi:hypothetical protein